MADAVHQVVEQTDKFIKMIGEIYKDGDIFSHNALPLLSLKSEQRQTAENIRNFQ